MNSYILALKDAQSKAAAEARARIAAETKGRIDAEQKLRQYAEALMRANAKLQQQNAQIAESRPVIAKDLMLNQLGNYQSR